MPKFWVRWFGICVFGAALLLAVGYCSLFAKSDAPAFVLQIKEGEGYYALLWQDTPAQTFAQKTQRAFRSKTLQRLYIRQRIAHAKPLQAGSYPIPAGASFAQQLELLKKGAPKTRLRLQILEGVTTKDLYFAIKTAKGVRLTILSPLGNDRYTWQDVAKDNRRVTQALGMAMDNPEGYFAPDTYFFDEGVSDLAILKTLYDRQARLLDEAWQNRAPDLPYQTPAELLIMASVVERETGLANERPLVASVFVNRLRQNMRLQTDPTIIYGLFDRYDGTIYRSNIQEKTAYNTYRIDGLPPTPIALPSVAALQAAAHPEDSDFLYFVATGKGGHRFSRTLEEHNLAVAAYRQTRAQNESR